MSLALTRDGAATKAKDKDPGFLLDWIHSLTGSPDQVGDKRRGQASGMTEREKRE